MRFRVTSAWVGMIGLCISTMIFLSGCGDEKREREIEAVDASGDLQPRDFELTDHTGKRRRLSEFRGKIVALFFGYTQCPDICPTTLSEFIQVNRALGTDADSLQVLFITVDPERDTQQLLGEYMPAFDARFIGMYGTQEELARVAAAFAVSYAKIPGQSGDTYSMDHTAYVFLLDKAGRLRLKVPHGQAASALVRLIREIEG